MAASRRTRQLYLKVTSKPSSRKPAQDGSSKHKPGAVREWSTQGKSKNWQPKFFQDPTQSWGYRRNKEVEGDPCETRCSQPLVESGTVPKSSKEQASLERLWQELFTDPTQWWDNRNNKHHDKSPDFRHKRARVELWIENGSTPEWVRQAIETKLPQRDEFSWTASISHHIKCGQAEQALAVFKEMRDSGVKPSSYTFVAALKACSMLKDLENCRHLHAQVVETGLDSDVFVGTMLVDVYTKCGSLVDARHVFEKMPDRNVVSWNAMILGYAQVQEGETALRLYTSMQNQHIAPDDRTFVAALKACGTLASLERGKEIHAQISTYGFVVRDLFVSTALIDMYGKCGSMADAQKVFDAQHKRDVVLWNALIAGYAHQGEGGLVFGLADRMIRQGLRPDSITFLNLLTVCSHVGLVDKGQKYFEAMTKDYAITPTIEHYNCMVDLLGRAGQVDRAMEMVKTMPFQPRIDVWRSMLGACRKWRNVELGKQAFDCAMRLDDSDAPTYVLMSNIYAAAHMLEDAKEVQAMRKKSGAWKKPGQSWWTDLGGTVHTFVVGDRTHPENQGIQAKLQNLLVRMKVAGYVPHLDSVLRDIPVDEKENALCAHSEKLAIAYALLKTAEGTTIRVVKNLRVCEDCHTAIALISKIEHRTIICRDASRFHVYREGKCSCRDYW